MRFSCEHPELPCAAYDFVGGRNAVMPVVVVFHERHALPLIVWAINRHRLAAAVRHRRTAARQRVDVVTVDLAGVPAERAPICRAAAPAS